MSLLLAVLMVLEVFSPVAVSARGLLDGEENHSPLTSEERVDPNSIFSGEPVKSKKDDIDDEFLKGAVKKQEPKKEINKLQEAPARQKESSTIIETPTKESPAAQNKVDNTMIEAGRLREQKAEDKLTQAVERAKKAEQNAKTSENLNLGTSEIEKPGYKAWRVVNRIKAIYKDGKLDCQGLLIEVEDFKGNKKTLTYDDILKDKNIIVNKEIKEGLFGSSELIIATPGLRDIKIDVKVENMKKDKDEKSALSLNKENSNKLEDKENTEEKEEKEGLLDKLKETLGLTDLQKADKELKKALADEKNSLEEIQALLISFEDKYNLSREDQAKLMEDNDEAIQELIKRDREGNFRPNMFMADPVGAAPLNLDDKKFTIRTRLDTSTIAGDIQPGQFFKIHLDPRLTVNAGTTLPDIVNNGTVLATPKYNKDTNTIEYKIVKPIGQNLQIPLAIDVDYNVAKINELDVNKSTHPINNSITGLGVLRPVKLPEVIVNNNGDVVNGITEPDGHEVLQIVEPGSDYKVYMDAHGSPVVKDGKLVAINWSVTFTSTKDLLSLGLSSNATTVKGSGLGDFSNLLLNGKEITTGLSKNEIEGKLGIVASKNHTLQESTREVRYTFETKITNPQEKYALDLSVSLNNMKKTGAVRLIYDAKDNKSYMEDTTSKRAGINNRTTILGEFSSDKTARWTVTDQVSTEDKNNGLPIAKRELTGDQELTSAKMAVYGLEGDINSPNFGKMVIKQSVDAPESKITSIPDKEANPSGQQLPGRIAVYEFNTNITESEAGYSLSGVNINKYQPLKIKQTWAGVDSTKNMPAQTIEVKDADGNALANPITVGEGTQGESSREFNLPAVKTWTIGNDGKETKITPNIVQTFPKGPTIGEKTYSYKEKYNYYLPEEKAYSIYNVITESTDEKDADFTIIKTDSEDPTKKLSGAKFTLQNASGTYTLETDTNGRASFKNVSPGTYDLVENKAPAGYKLDKTTKRIIVSNDGKVSVTGDNISMQGGHIATVTARHNYYPSYPSYMNAMHYGNIDENGNVEFYIYLKPEANRNGGSTDKDTRLNLNLAGGGQIDTVEVIDVAPNTSYSGYKTRSEVVTAMQKQTASTITGNNVINQNAANDITGTKDVTDAFTGKKGYQVKFPTARFANDWGFLVKVKATGGKSTSAVSYDWLTDTGSVANEAKIQETIGLSTEKPSDSTPTNPKNNNVKLNITNEEFQKAPIEISKVKENGVDALTGATFKLLDSKGNPIMDAKAVLDKDGKKATASFGDQAPGNYTIEEARAPQGYKKSNVVFDVNVTDDGKVTYKARFKDGNGTPINGIDYILEDVEIKQDENRPTFTSISQQMILQEKQNQPDDGRLGWQEGIWEAYGIESYKYVGNFKISQAKKGGKFKIQFDPNLDFKRYVYEIPDLKDATGKLLAKPYFNYDTNLLTYVFEDDIKSEVNASMQIIGIIPDKYYATQTDKINGYNFKITVDPDNPDVSKMTPGSNKTNNQTTESKNNILTVNIKTDYYTYDSQGGGGPLTSEYITDIYKGKDGKMYVKAVSYYNPTSMSSGIRTLRLDWLSMKKPKPGLYNYRADGYPAFGFNDLKIYKVNDNPTNKQTLMPLSYGIRPEQDPTNYNLVYTKSGVNPQTGFSESTGDVRVTYRPENLKSSEGLMDYGHEKHPLEIQLPRVNKNEGYVVVQTFQVTDEQRFKDLWSAYYLSNGERHTGSYQKGNYNWAIGSETGQEIPTSYTQKVKLINKTYKPGSFKIKKLNEADTTQTLADASFELIDDEGKIMNRFSGTDGIIEFNALEPGVYTLQESQAPKGFTKSNKRWQVRVYDTGNVYIREVGGTGAGSEFTGTTEKIIEIPVTNKPVGEEFKVYKKKSDGTPLAHAKFVIRDKDDTKDVASGESNEKGIVTFTPALERNKTYIIKETDAPKGYKKLEKKWVLVIDSEGNKKVYNKREKTTTNLDSIIEQDGVKWVDVPNRDLTGWNLDDNRQTDWTGKYPVPYKLGTRIVAINRNPGQGQQPYVIQRYVLNPEAKSIGATTATIHREKLNYPNMDWYNGSAVYQVFKLDKAVTGNIADIRLAEYNPTEITNDVKHSMDKTRSGEPARLKLEFKATDKPIVVDVKVPYTSETGGVGTGMDWTENGITYWKSDFYEKAEIIKEAGPAKQESTGIIGSYVAEGSLDVTNESKTFSFKLKKVKEDNAQAIQGAEFKLTGPGESKDERFMTTGSDGMISFDKLTPGTYKLEETKAAPGYEIANNGWEVKITDNGKVFIKVVAKTNNTNNPAGTSSRSAQASNGPVEANTILTVGNPNSTEEKPVLNLRLAKQMQDIKSAQYGIASEINGKSPLKSQTEIKRDAVRQNINSIYGENNLENQLADGITFREMAMAAYNKDTALGANSGLEISDEIVPVPVRAGGWEDVDPNASTGRAGVAHSASYMETKITEINKDTDRFKQQFLFKPKGGANFNGLVEIHRQPEKNSYGGGLDFRLTNGSYVISTINIYEVDAGSTLNDIRNQRPISTIKPEQFRASSNIMRVKATIPAGKTILMEVEAPYADNGTLGLGADYQYDTPPSSQYDTTKKWKDWAADSYSTETKVNDNVQEKTYTITTSTDNNGSLRVEVGGVVKTTGIKAGERVAIYPQPNDGYELADIKFNDISKYNPSYPSYHFTMPEGNVSISATFRKIPLYNVNIDPNIKNGKLETNKSQAKEDESVTITITPDPGYLLQNIWVNNSSWYNYVRNGKLTFDMGNGDADVTASFVRDSSKVIMSFNPNGGTGTMEKQVLNYGSYFTVPECGFTPPAGKVFSRWDINGYKYSPGDGFYVNYDYTLKAEWKNAPVTLENIRVNSTDHKINYKVGDQLDTNNLTIEALMSDGSKQTIDVTPQMVSGFDSSQAATNKPLTITYSDKTTTYNVNIVEPEPDSYEVKIGESTNGKVETDKDFAKKGDTVTLTPVPNDGFKLDSYKVTDANGNPIKVTDNKFKMPNSAVNVSATFTSDGTSIPSKPSDNEIEIPEGKFAQITNKQTGIELKIFKKNSADAALQGAVFELKKTNDDYSKDDGDFTKVYAESDDKGNVRFFEDENKKIPVKLKVGKYLLTETKSPAGYKKPAAPWKLEVKEVDGQLVITQSGPKYNSSSFLSSKDVNAGQSSNTDTIKYKSIVKSIDPVNKTFVQRIYIDTRNYKGNSDKINVQINPKHKREEIDRPAVPPVTIKEGVKTAYRTTYKITNPDASVNPDDVLKHYDLSKANVSVINTARWRPFDWGFDEDQINLEKGGVYFIDVEGFYDSSIVDNNVTNEVMINNTYDFVDKNGNKVDEPILKDPGAKNNIPQGDLGKIELNVDFYEGARTFYQKTYENNQFGWKKDPDIGVDDNGQQIKRDASYQKGMEAIYKKYKEVYANQGAAAAEAWFKGKTDGGKYPIWLRKGAYVAGTYYNAGIIYPYIDPKFGDKVNKLQSSTTSIDIKSLYSSDSITTIPQDGMTITNEDEVYNITFSKHAKLKTDGTNEDYNANRLEGAVFKLQKKEGSFWNDLDESYVASAFNGYFGFRRLEPGRYRLLEVTPPIGYKPIDGELLEFTIKQIDTRSGKIINPKTKKEVPLMDLTIIDPYNQEQIALKDANAKIKGDTTNTVYNFSDLVKDEKFDIETCLILSKVVDKNTNKPKEIPLKEANFIDPETKEPMGKIVSGAQGYITLEYKEGGYVSEYGSAGGKGGALVDYVTAATAKNMGKILNEKPGKGKVTIKKLDENGQPSDELIGTKFKAIRISGKKDENGNPLADAIYPGEVKKQTDGENKAIIEGLPIGEYELIESEPKSGHINTGQKWHFTVGGKDLDPYAGDIARTGHDISSKITLDKSDLKVIRPDPEDEKETGSEGNKTIRPHIGQSLEFDNEFKLAPNTEIKPGDYFVLKLSDNMDLVGIRTDNATNLDLFADGVGTIAKADYDKDKGTITYTFTKYAEQYKLLNFQNKLSAHINFEKVKNSGKESVGLGLGNNIDKPHDINVKYVVDTIERSDGTNTINLASKLYRYNATTGEFVHYYYINRDGKYNGKNLYFRYTPSIDVNDLQFTYYKLKDSSKEKIAEDMPESFAINENSQNLERVGGMPPVSASANVTTNEQKIGVLPKNGPMIVKVTGKMKTDNLMSYRGTGDLYNYNSFYDYYGYYVTEKYPGVSRVDWIFAFENTNTASADLTIFAVNPTNKIQFKKVDPNGRAIKPTEFESDGKAKNGAKFSIHLNGGTAEQPNTTWTAKTNPEFVNKDGIISYEKLEKGYYKLVEDQAPDGYIKPKDPVAYFKVDDSGKIYQEVTVPTADGKGTQKIFKEVQGTIPINIINNKPIEFEKVDGEDNTKKLQGAEFNVQYKEKPGDKYVDYKVTDASGNEKTLTAKSDKDGKFKLELTKDGYYALKETKAPEGYGNFPGLIREFKIKDGKVQVFEKDPLKASFTEGPKGMISSQITEVNEKDKTFKQRLFINLNHKSWTFDGPDTVLKLSVNGWNIEDTNKEIKLAVVDNGKTLRDLKDEDFNRSVSPRENSKNTNTLVYTIKDLYGDGNYTVPEAGKSNITTDKTLVVEFTGKLNESQTEPLDLKAEVYSNAFSESIDDVAYNLDIKNVNGGKGAYINPIIPIQVENKKGEYPSTGGMGTLIFTVSGLILMTAAAYVYSRKRRTSYDE